MIVVATVVVVVVVVVTMLLFMMLLLPLIADTAAASFTAEIDCYFFFKSSLLKPFKKHKNKIIVLVFGVFVGQKTLHHLKSQKGKIKLIWNSADMTLNLFSLFIEYEKYIKVYSCYI